MIPVSSTSGASAAISSGLTIRLAIDHEEIAAALDPEFLIHLAREALHHFDAQLGQLDVDRSGELVADAARVQSCRPESEHLTRFEDDDVGTAPLGEMVGGACPHYPAADDDDVGSGLHDGTDWFSEFSIATIC